MLYCTVDESSLEIRAKINIKTLDGWTKKKCEGNRYYVRREVQTSTRSEVFALLGQRLLVFVAAGSKVDFDVSQKRQTK